MRAGILSVLFAIVYPLPKTSDTKQVFSICWVNGPCESRRIYIRGQSSLVILGKDNGLKNKFSLENSF